MVNKSSLEKGGEPLEIERKFLIRYPDVDMLEKLGCKKIIIRQDYLPTIENKVSRIRKATINNKSKYFYTEKYRLSDAVRIEKEKEISPEEYNDIFEHKRAVDANPINKTRYLLEDGTFCFEIDIYPEWDSKALVEVELPTETSLVQLPDWMKVIREVTGDERYKNHSLAFKGFDGL